MRLKARACLRALAAIVGCAVALAQSQPQTMSGIFQVVVAEELGRNVPVFPESLQYRLLTGTEAVRVILEDPRDAAQIAPGSLVQVTGYRTGRQLTVPADSVQPDPSTPWTAPPSPRSTSRWTARS